jgi:anthranilate phosphoribosyltransferase
VSALLAALGAVVDRRDLARAEMAAAMHEIADGAATPAQLGAFLAALRAKGETVEEMTGAVLVMRERAERVRVRREIFVDTCGTGGDGQHTFNVSTTSAFVVAAAGVAVAKHGNRSVSSRCGSADVLAELGVVIDLSAEQAAACVDEIGLGFLFAPRLHPAFRAVAAVRRELGLRTMFNLLGPLVNPAGAPRQVMGVFDARWVPVVGRVLAELGAEHALVVHGDGSDEIALSGDTVVCEVRRGSVEDRVMAPEELELPRSERASLAGGDAATNARLLRAVLDGEPGPRRDAVLANAGAALYVGAAAESPRDGARLAARAIDSGEAAAVLARLVATTRRLGA